MSFNKDLFATLFGVGTDINVQSQGSGTTVYGLKLPYTQRLPSIESVQLLWLSIGMAAHKTVAVAVPAVAVAF